MLMRLMLKLTLAVAVVCLCAAAQEVQLSPVKGGIQFSVPAQQAYQLMPGETKRPVLSVECLQHKGKKGGHLVLFSPGGIVASDQASGGSGAGIVLTVNGKKLASAWTVFGDTDSYIYAGATDADRVQFLRSLLGSIVTIEFRPFLTGTPTTATFDLSNLAEAIRAHPECGAE